VFLAYSLRRVLPRLSEPTPRPKVRSLAWAATAATHPQTPTQARLGERLSPERDSTSLKTKTLRLARARVRAGVGSLQVSPRRDQVAWARLTDHATVQPASTIHSHLIIFPTISYVHNNM